MLDSGVAKAIGASVPIRTNHRGGVMTMNCILRHRTHNTAEITCGTDSYFLEEITGGIYKGKTPDVAVDDRVGLERLAAHERRGQPQWVVVRVNSVALGQAITEPSWERLDDSQLIAALSTWIARQSSTE